MKAQEKITAEGIQPFPTVIELTRLLSVLIRDPLLSPCEAEI